MIKRKSKGKDIILTVKTLPNIITSIEYDHDAQQAVFFYQPVEGYDVAFAIVPVNLEEVPYYITMETLGVTNEELWSHSYITR